MISLTKIAKKIVSSSTDFDLVGLVKENSGPEIYVTFTSKPFDPKRSFSGENPHGHSNHEGVWGHTTEEFTAGKHASAERFITFWEVRNKSKLINSRNFTNNDLKSYLNKARKMGYEVDNITSKHENHRQETMIELKELIETEKDNEAWRYALQELESTSPFETLDLVARGSDVNIPMRQRYRLFYAAIGIAAIEDHDGVIDIDVCVCMDPNEVKIINKYDRDDLSLNI